MNIVPKSRDLSGLRHELDAITGEIRRLLDRRAHLMYTTVAELHAHGTEAHIVDQSVSMWKPDIGDRVTVFDSYHSYSRHVERAVRMDHADRPATVGPWAGEHGVFLVEHGTFEVLMRDGDDYLVAKVPDVDDLERGHRLAISRLRTLAKNSGLRVQVKDRAVALVDPVGVIVHDGDAVTSHMYLLGIPRTCPVREREE